MVVTVDQGAITPRYRLDVMATSIVDVVSCAGGWLFDRAMAGWDVTVLVAAYDDVRPLQILGAKAIDLKTAVGGPERWPDAVSVAAELYETDDPVRQFVHHTLKRTLPEITIWGEHRPLALNRRIASVHHELSAAARVFKAQALAAAAHPADSVDPVETFGRVRRNSRVAADSFCQRYPDELAANRVYNSVSARVINERS
jgi:hypothetical protein